MEKTIEIPEGYEARIEGNKVILEPKESEDERVINFLYCELTTLCAKECNEGGNGSDRYNTLVAAMDWLEKQKEQKPAECVADSRKFDEGFKTGREVGFREGVESVKPEQKWDEEDEEMLEDIISNFQFNKGEMTDALIAQYNRFFDKIMSLKPQSQQEWSEEDEKSIEKLDGFLSEVFCYGHVYVSQKDKEELQNWLKSLRPQPHWKPSEEQMRAVFDASERNDKLGSVLRNLYNDLKKLM